jgi:hypothetical protein
VDTGLFNVISDKVWALVFLAAMLGATEIGYRLGRKYQTRFGLETESGVLAIASALLGVLGLLLGFTVSMAVSRYETRTQLALAEANAVGRAYLRTKLLPPSEGAEIAHLLSEYTEAHLQFDEDEPGRIEEVRRRSDRIKGQFWDKAVIYAKKDPNDVTALFLESLNEVIDLEAARWRAYNNVVPGTVLYMNALVALLAANLIGYGLGLRAQRQLFATCMLAVAIAIVMAVILDLDSPRQGFIRVSQQALIDLQQQLPPLRP